MPKINVTGELIMLELVKLTTWLGGNAEWGIRTPGV